MKNIRQKKRFLAQQRDTTIPILQRCQTKDKYSQKCQIIREEGEGCSGSSRGIPNIVIPIENAAIDQYSSEFNNIIEGTDINHQYHSLSTQIGYHELHYDSVMKEYKLKNVSNVEEAPPNPPAASSLFSLHQIQLLAAFCRSEKFENYPPCVTDILNATSENDLLNNALSHDKWQDNTIPVYEIHKSHFPEDLYDELELNPDDLIFFFTFFLAR